MTACEYCGSSDDHHSTECYLKFCTKTPPAALIELASMLKRGVQMLPEDQEPQLVPSVIEALRNWAASWEADLAALDRARALLVKLRDGIDDYWGFCNPEIIADLAALLAPASGGAA